MRLPTPSLILRLAIGLAVGLVEPYLELAWKCRAGFETSEACVWRSHGFRRWSGIPAGWQKAVNADELLEFKFEGYSMVDPAVGNSPV
jgi:hypothetical protein